MVEKVRPVHVLTPERQAHFDAVYFDAIAMQQYGKTDQAFTLMQRALEIDSLSAPALYYMSDAYRKMEKPALALASLEADYTNKYDQQYYQKLAQIESSKTSSQLELTDLEAKYEMLVFEQNRAEEQSDDNGDNLQILLAIKEQENQLVTEMENLKSQSQDLSDSIEKMQEKLDMGTVRAQVSGVINLSQELTAGCKKDTEILLVHDTKKQTGECHELQKSIDTIALCCSFAYCMRR